MLCDDIVDCGSTIFPHNPQSGEIVEIVGGDVVPHNPQSQFGILQS